MDGETQRLNALVLTVAIVVALTGLITLGVLHKINEKILKPGEDMKSAPYPPSTQKEN